MKKIIIAITALLLVTSVTADASLVDNGDGTVTQTRNDGSVLMWLKDANASMTMGWHSTGDMSWTQAISWISYLNSSNYLGYNDWRLPEALPVNSISYDLNLSYDGSTDIGYNILSPNSELGYMYYVELGNLSYYDTSGSSPQPGWGLTNTGPFQNLYADWYWYGTEYPAWPSYKAMSYSFGFPTTAGKQDQDPKVNSHYAWAVRNVSVVPEPISSTLFIVGGIVLGVNRLFKRNKIA